MSRVGFAGTCMAATLLTLWSQAPMAQGLLQEGSQPFDGILSHDPLGPSQTFGGWSPGSEAKSLTLERAPAAQQADVQSQAQRRSHADSRKLESKSLELKSLALKPRPAAVRSFARQDDGERGGAGSVLALAPVKSARARPLCFPSTTIHLQPGQRDACNGGAAAVRGRFEELLHE
jgi:hypothetical protein